LKDSGNQARQIIIIFKKGIFLIFSRELILVLYQTENRRRGVNGGGERNRAAGLVTGGAVGVTPAADPVTTTGR
jgi:hypothetical protein